MGMEITKESKISFQHLRYQLFFARIHTVCLCVSNVCSTVNTQQLNNSTIQTQNLIRPKFYNKTITFTFFFLIFGGNEFSASQKHMRIAHDMRHIHKTCLLFCVFFPIWIHKTTTATATKTTTTTRCRGKKKKQRKKSLFVNLHFSMTKIIMKFGRLFTNSFVLFVNETHRND